MTQFAPRKGMNSAEIEETIEAIIAEATLEEKVGMMSGKGFFQAMARTGGVWGGEPYRAGGGIERLGVPALYFTDGPRGVARGSGDTGSTCFPCTMARGASWDRDLERRIGEVMGAEARAQGCTLSGAVCVNLLRHPGWGRAQETYGEDPFHLGELGASLAQGIQAHNVVATVKHYALNSIENARFKIDVRIDGRVLREVYLPHFKRILDAGCASVMSAYNKMNGEYCGQHRELLTDILRHEWGFDGFVHSDWMLGVYAPYGASAGLDVENPEPLQFGERLIEGVQQQQVEPGVIDTACRRILRIIYRFACAEDPLAEYTQDIVANDAHIAVAREAAEKSAVLLKNEGALPLDKGANVGVFGSLAAMVNTGDDGSSKVSPPYVTTALAGIASYLGEPDIPLSGDESDVAAAAEAAKGLDAAIVVVGTTAEHEGEFIPGDIGQSALMQPGAKIPEELKLMIAAMIESQAEKQGAGHNSGAMGAAGDRGGDREKLRLPDDQADLVKAIAEANPNTIVVIASGSAIICDWAGSCAAILQTFYSGMEGGTALARLLFGDVSPSGKLPFTVANDEGEYPFFDKNADVITYDLWHGYTKFERDGVTPQFPFGHGLSYASFAYRSVKAARHGDAILAQVSVTNTGTVAADEVVQFYISPPGKSIERQKKLLKGFERVAIAPGETVHVHVSVPTDDLRWYNEATGSWTLETGEYSVLAGGSSADLIAATLSL
ncbi:beta-glucosidase family protein [Erythrobacter ani]|uniref:Glycoside hydrolase family 3 C-terminal domain-containing protein n=1 Tax=Erythrobacter ani TaxID=2827235 RepID=A0ABS6SM63_9SPHN|nr:glycoside hydrolase family 3 C-terminal domain-containing protein [Erythrobacter ani]MBV7266134.1 glycoside hydrolase family 3 C-terminal domain-containing protein [Erythrobacter ani]